MHFQKDDQGKIVVFVIILKIVAFPFLILDPLVISWED